MRETSNFNMPFVDTQRYEIFDYMPPEIPEGGQRLEIPYKLITKEMLYNLIEPHFGIEAGT